MTTITKSAVAVLAVLALGMGIAPNLLAEEAPAAAPQSGAMTEEHTKGEPMMNMMARMNSMMDRCERMMQSHSDPAKRPDNAPER